MDEVTWTTEMGMDELLDGGYGRNGRTCRVV